MKKSFLVLFPRHDARAPCRFFKRIGTWKGKEEGAAPA
jgi:hypothetical protein